MRDGSEHDGGRPSTIETLETFARFIDDHQRVNPDVAFGMPLRLLLAADERVHFRPESFDHADVACEGESERRTYGLQQEFLDLAPHTFGGQVVERNAAQDRAGLRIDVEVETCGE